MRLLPKPINQTTGEPSWRWRRLMVFAVIAFCMAVLLRLIDSSDTGINAVIAQGSMWLIGVISLIYAGFATVQDVAAIIATKRARPYLDPPPAEAPDAPSPADRDIAG